LAHKSFFFTSDQQTAYKTHNAYCTMQQVTATTDELAQCCVSCPLHCIQSSMLNVINKWSSSMDWRYHVWWWSWVVAN